MDGLPPMVPAAPIPRCVYLCRMFRQRASVIVVCPLLSAGAGMGRSEAKSRLEPALSACEHGLAVADTGRFRRSDEG